MNNVLTVKFITETKQLKRYAVQNFSCKMNV